MMSLQVQSPEVREALQAYVTAQRDLEAQKKEKKSADKELVKLRKFLEESFEDDTADFVLNHIENKNKCSDYSAIDSNKQPLSGLNEADFLKYCNPSRAGTMKAALCDDSHYRGSESAIPRSFDSVSSSASSRKDGMGMPPNGMHSEGKPPGGSARAGANLSSKKAGGSQNCKTALSDYREKYWDSQEQADAILSAEKDLAEMKSQAAQLVKETKTTSNLTTESGVCMECMARGNGYITQQPASKATCAGTAVSFSVGAAGTGLSYQWQQSLDVGATFSNIAGATQATYSIANPLLLQNGQQFRVQVTGTCTPAITSTMATLTVTQPINISSQPQAVSVCAGRTVSFTVQAAGPALTYQWELSTNGNNFVSLANGGDYSGANSNTLLIANAGIALNGNQYRVLVSGTACAPVASAPALLTVHPLPVVTVAPPSVVNITPYQPITLTGIASPAGNYTYVWLRDGTPVPGANAPAIIVNVDLLGTYQLSATDARGCSNVSNLVQVNDTSSTLLFIYPNPNNGVFQVRYYQAGTASSERSLQVYDAKGASIFRQRFVAVGGGYQRMDVKLSKRPASGVYFVQLRDTAGKKLAAAAIRIQ
ncbi:MAG: T9SS type A sorting domain-containing protein [Chitinophagaceae bacterium]|nr:MAG: T9SS type A sorting domain-containing protein [Chitinophagaceae bacterium]